MNRMSWDEYGLEIAKTASFRSEDPFLKVGAAVFRKDRSIVGVGYNGAASGVNISWDNRDARRSFVIHAEINALRYCTPHDTEDGFIYTTHHPCLECIKVIASYKIKSVIYKDLIDGSVYDLEAVANLATKYEIKLQQKGNA